MMTGSPTASERLDHLAEGWRPWLLLILLSLALYLPGIERIPPVDRDEARYVQATRQMLETGDFLRIRFQGEARNKKPAGIYWLQAVAVAALSIPQSTALWPYRLVSLVGASGGVLLTFLFGARIFDRRTALLGAALLAGSVDLVFEAHVATTDALLLGCAVAAQGALATIYLEQRRGEVTGRGLALVFWIAQGLAILIKGPVVPLLSLLTGVALIAMDRRAGWLGRLHAGLGLPVVLVMVAPWLILIEWATQGAFLEQAVGHDLLGKVAGAQEAHGAWPGYYLTLTPFTFWPGALFLGLGAVWAWRSRRLGAAKVLLAWLVPFWLVLEGVPTKLPHYVLPLYPAVALICARAILAGEEEGMASPSRWISGVLMGLWCGIALVLGFGLLVGPGFVHAPWVVAGLMAAAAATIGCALLLRQGRLGLEAVAIVLPTALVVLVCGFGGVLPDLRPLWLSCGAADLVGASALGRQPIGVAGYSEPSLVFLLGTDTILEPAAALARDLDAGRVGAALVSDREIPAFEAALAAVGGTAARLGEISGFDYSNGHWLTLALYRRGAP
jgi:4-amino-4-deoxy-L-arabinose transferase-like glycosyltransferase